MKNKGLEICLLLTSIPALLLLGGCNNAQGNPGAPVAQVRLAYMRYVGQGHEIPVPLPLRRLQADDVATIRAAYESEYAKFYDRLVPGAEIEVLSYEVTVSTLVPEGPKAVANGGGSDAGLGS